MSLTVFSFSSIPLGIHDIGDEPQLSVLNAINNLREAKGWQLSILEMI